MRVILFGRKHILSLLKVTFKPNLIISHFNIILSQVSQVKLCYFVTHFMLLLCFSVQWPPPSPWWPCSLARSPLAGTMSFLALRMLEGIFKTCIIFLEFGSHWKGWHSPLWYWNLCIRLVIVCHELILWSE